MKRKISSCSQKEQWLFPPSRMLRIRSIADPENPFLFSCVVGSDIVLATVAGFLRIPFAWKVLNQLISSLR